MKQVFHFLTNASCALLIGITGISSGYAEQIHTASPRSFKITFNNQANNSAITHVYVVLKGSVNNTPCFIKVTKLVSPDDQTISQCEPVTLSTKPADYAFDAVNNVTFRIAPLASGRMYVSINKPLIMHINPDRSVAEPSVYDTNPISNPDYTTLFDKVEFTYNPDGNTFVNPTAVDFLSLPLSIAQGSHVFGLAMDRRTAFDQIQYIFKKEISTTQYQRLVITNGNVLLRILAPGREPTFFDPTYLNEYIDWMFNKYYFSPDGTAKTANHTLTLQLVEASGVIPGKPRVLTDDEGKFTGFVQASTQSFIFTNALGDTITIPRLSFSSNGLFMAAIDNIQVILGATTKNRIAAIIAGMPKPQPNLQDTLNALMAGYKAVTVKFIASAWAVGLLPTPTGDVIDQNYIRQKIGTDVETIYTERADLPPELQNRGPWYQLYGKAIHLLTPHLYAFPYDDVLGLDGTNALNDSQPVVVTLNSMTDTVVPPTDIQAIK